MSDNIQLKTGNSKVVVRSEHEWERVCYAEILVPDIPNVFGDINTRETIREFAYEFALQGYGIDVEHDNVDINGHGSVVVESFIARKNDPDFIEGSWVVGMKVLDDALWQQVLAGVINGFSFEAECSMFPVVFQNLANRQVVGVTEPDPLDGHTHSFLVILSPLNRPISGGTGNTNGHVHAIVTHTTTESSENLAGKVHNHRYQVIVSEQ